MEEGSEPACDGQPEQAEPQLPGPPCPPRETPPSPARSLGGPARGFGRMWQKTYSMNIGSGISPQAAMAAWRRSFPGLWPGRHGRGVTVNYSDAESFTVTTGPNDPLAGWVTLSAEQDGTMTRIRIHVLVRAQDPLCELALALGGYRKEDRFWVAAMSELAARLGVPAPVIETRGICLDARHKWANTRNVRHSPVLRGVAKAAGSPLSVVRLSVLGLWSRMPG